MVGYICDYLHLYHHPPNVFDTTESLGIAFPVFYGVLFYRFLGLLALLLRPNGAIHCAIFLGVIAEVLAVYRAARAMRAPIGIALLCCAGVAGSTYQLTNLYNRGDLPEFFACCLLTTALASWFWSCAASGSLERWFCRAIIAGALTLMAGTHSITLALGGVTFFFVSGVTLLVERKRVDVLTYAVALIAFLVGAAISLSDYVLVAHQIRFVGGPYQFGFGMMTDRLDSPAARFSLFPYDPATLYNGVRQVSTPYLEAPIDYTLLLFAVGVLIVRRDVVPFVFVVLAVFVAAISVWPKFWDFVPGPFHFFQFTYRLTNYANAFSLAAALATLWRLPRQARRVAGTPVPWMLATLACTACLIKLNHAALFSHDEPAVRPISYYTDLGPIAETHTDYTTMPHSGPPAPDHPLPPPVAMAALGQPVPQRYTADRSGLLYTRILVLPWNKIVVDGDVLAEQFEVAWSNSPYYGVREPAGSTHVVNTYLQLPPVVDALIRLAEYALICEIGAIAAFASVWLVRRIRPLRA